MSAILDLIGSFIIGGLLLLMILAVNNNASQFSIENGQQLTTQENLIEFINEIEYDFRKIGYHVPVHNTAIVSCDSTSLTFLADLDNNGTVETVTYSVSNPSQVRGTENPIDRQLIRRVNASQVQNSLGLTRFRLRYFDSNGALTATTTAIKSIEVSLQVESSFAIEGNYAQSSWQTRIYPRNLQ